ncbi:hypothetical protein [Pseudoxanthomonas daejeonensis]|uniref:Uncharacterized protein n=1 Tax=Pseudoxanthomonas daejeonensis TaxID=266062 RepID=A0ABQ6ZB62_9GAMM|nr:hypothetical protein [Pseudoxanthomonas daejeonensis]KAF1697336.1 hypothetical protein CSC65_00185 [Pseudoxanthomonas daejeonensis]
MESSLHERAPHDPGARATTTLQARLRPWLGALCDAGCGLVLWVALSSALLLGASGTLRKLVDLQVWGLGLGVLLAAAGFGLLWPRPTAPGRWWIRTVTALALVAASGVALAGLHLQPQPDPAFLALCALLACIGALATVAGLSMLEGGQAGLLLPTRLALSLLSGATLLFALIALRWPGPIMAAGPVPSLLLLVLVAVAMVVASWMAQGGLRAWTRHRGRWLVLGLLAILPLLAAALLYLQPGWARVLWPLVALSVLAGAVIERLQVR